MYRVAANTFQLHQQYRDMCAYRREDLVDVQAPVQQRIISRFRRSILVYLTAKVYGLRNLQAVAKQEAEYLRDLLSLVETEQALEGISSIVAEDDKWFYNFIVCGRIGRTRNL